MFNKENVTPYSEFTYWFTYTRNYGYNVSIAETRDFIGTANESADGALELDFDLEKVDIAVFRHDWNMFKSNRPEYRIAKEDFTNDMNQEDMVTAYETKLVGVALARAKSNGVEDPDVAISKIEKCLTWLRSTDFYTAPASTVYHESITTGLLKHTLNVCNEVIGLHGINKFCGVYIESAILIALVHDWCKIGFYESYMKNVKDDATGEWHKEPAFRYKSDSMFCLGHGVSSAYAASKFFKLTMDEFSAIRWHMGWCRVAADEKNELQQCNELNPLAHLIQFADQLSIVRY